VLSRIHTVAAVALIAAVPLGPLGMWVYARAAGADRGAAQRFAEHIVATVRPPQGGRTELIQPIDVRAWDGDGLVPVKAWRLDYAVHLPKRTTPAALIARYTRELPDWRRRIEHLDCSEFSMKPGCAAVDVRFTKASSEIELDMGEYLGRNGQTITTYGLNVSQ
jgi:hypothetical protein